MATILVIDDDTQLRTLIVRILEMENHQIVEAVNGIEGIRCFRKQKIDLVITDILMPDKDGIEVIREIRSAHPDVKMIAISGGGQLGADQYLTLAKKLGAQHTLLKPFQREDLLEIVNHLLKDSKS